MGSGTFPVRRQKVTRLRNSARTTNVGPSFRPLVQTPEFECPSGFLNHLNLATCIAEIGPVSGSLLLTSKARWMKNEEKYFSGSQAQALSARRSGAPDATLCVIWAPWDLPKKVPLSAYLNGFGLAVSWTRLGKVRSSRIRNLCLKGTPSVGRKKFGDPTTLFRGQKVRKGASTYLYFSLNIFADFF